LALATAVVEFLGRGLDRDEWTVSQRGKNDKVRDHRGQRDELYPGEELATLHVGAEDLGDDETVGGLVVLDDAAWQASRGVSLRPWSLVLEET
jgi:hypothetical protein